MEDTPLKQESRPAEPNAAPGAERKGAWPEDSPPTAMPTNAPASDSKGLKTEFHQHAFNITGQVNLRDPILRAGLSTPKHPKKALLSRIYRLLADDFRPGNEKDPAKLRQIAQERQEALAAVRKAVALIRRPGVYQATEAKRGYIRTKNFHLAVARTVAEMNLDIVVEQEENGDSAPTKAEVEDSRSKTSKGRAKAQAQPQRTGLQRVESIVASILQEFVALGSITPEEIKANFGEDSGIAQLTLALSNVSRMPIGRRMPDDSGQLSVQDILYNKRQAELSQDLLLLSKHAPRVTMVKIADSLQQLRDLDDIVPTDPTESPEAMQRRRIKIALHIRDMYLPLVRELGLWTIQREMQERLLKILDPHSDAFIETDCARLASQETMAESEATIRHVFEGALWEIPKRIKRIKDKIEQRYNEQNEALRDVRQGIARAKSGYMRKAREQVAEKLAPIVAKSKQRLERVRHTFDQILNAVQPKGGKSTPPFKIKGRRKTNYSIWAKFIDHYLNTALSLISDIDAALVNAEPEAAKQLLLKKQQLLETKVPDHQLLSINLGSLYDLVGFRITVPFIGTREDPSKLDESMTYRMIRLVDRVFSKKFKPMKNRIKDYYQELRKPGYAAFHNTYHIKLETQFVPVEVQFDDEVNAKLNAQTHGYYKKRAMLIAGYHPAPKLVDEGREHAENCAATIKEINARLEKKGPLPAGCRRQTKIVCDCVGNLMPVPIATTLHELIQMAYDGGGGYCEPDGTLLRNVKPFLLKHLIDTPMDQNALAIGDQPVPHAAFVPYLRFDNGQSPAVPMAALLKTEGLSAPRCE